MNPGEETDSSVESLLPAEYCNKYVRPSYLRTEENRMTGVGNNVVGSFRCTTEGSATMFTGDRKTEENRLDDNAFGSEYEEDERGQRERGR